MGASRLLVLNFGLTVLIQAGWAQAVMPASLHKELDVGSPKRALAQLKRNPRLVNSRDKEGRETPLHLAAARGHTDVVRWLVQHGADVNARCYNEFTPLHLASNAPIATILVKAGGKLNVHSSFGATPMQCAAEQARFGIGGRLAVVEAIRKSGEPLDLYSALCLEKGELARAMIRTKPGTAKTINVGGRTVLHVAAGNGDIDTVKLLLKIGMDVDTGDEVGMNFGGRFTALADAVWAHQTKMVKFLCESGANPNKLGRQLELALRGPPSEITKTLKYYSELHKRGR